MRVVGSLLLVIAGLAACDTTELSNAPKGDGGGPLFCGPGTEQLGPECVVAGHGGCACPDGTACPDGDLSKCTTDGGPRADAGVGDCKCANGTTCPNGELSECGLLPDGGHPDAGTCTLEVRAWIAGHSELAVQGKDVWWENKADVAPGLGAGSGDHSATVLSTCEDHGNWCPLWNSGACDTCTSTSTTPCAEGALSSEKFTTLDPALPAAAQTVGFKINRVSCTNSENAAVSCCRGRCGIVQDPSIENQYTLILDFDDSMPPGAAWYDLTVQYKKE